MKRFSILISAIILIGCMGAFADTVITIDGSYIGDSSGLDHSKAYLWAIKLDSYLPPDEVLSGATLYLDDVQNNMEPEANDILYITLLDLTTASGATTNQEKAYTDNQNGTNYFGSAGSGQQWYWTSPSLIDTYTDNNDYSTKCSNPVWQTKTECEENGFKWKDRYSRFVYVAEDLEWDLNLETIDSYISDNGWLGIGLDADCHYLFSGFRLVLTTEPQGGDIPEVPEPTTILLVGIGLVSLGVLKRNVR